MEIDSRPEAVFNDSGDHLPYHLHQSNSPVLTLPFWEEYHGGPGQFRWYATLPEPQLRHN